MPLKYLWLFLIYFRFIHKLVLKLNTIFFSFNHANLKNQKYLIQILMTINYNNG